MVKSNHSSERSFQLGASIFEKMEYKVHLFLWVNQDNALSSLSIKEGIGASFHFFPSHPTLFPFALVGFSSFLSSSTIF